MKNVEKILFKKLKSTLKLQQYCIKQKRKFQASDYTMQIQSYKILRPHRFDIQNFRKKSF